MSREMLGLLEQARAFSYAPLSNFHVGAVVRGGSGRDYLGANLEVPGLPLGQTVHAEQAALANAYMAGESSVAAIAVTAAPCGHCRQFLIEMSPSAEIQVILPRKRTVTLARLLPSAFGPLDLKQTRGALPPSKHRLKLRKPQTSKLVQAAFEAASRSYAPYTRSYAGVALLTADRRIIRGSYIENAAFNPSLSPLQTALAVLLSSGLKITSVVRGVLVEVEGTPVNHLDSTRVALSALVPSAKLDQVTVLR